MGVVRRDRRALEKLGGDISVARRRRGIGHGLTAERAFISPGTLVRAEKGDPGVSIGVYASLLLVLDLTDRLAVLADPHPAPKKRIRPTSRIGEGDSCSGTHSIFNNGRGIPSPRQCGGKSRGARAEQHESSAHGSEPLPTQPV